MTTTDRLRLGRFTLHEELGRGGFAVVYRARDPVRAADVALKVLHAHLMPDPTARRRFLREAELAARIEHPNLMRTLEAGDADGRLYLVLELIDGRSLDHHLRMHGPLPLSSVATLLVGLGRAVDALHAAGLVHRDVTAANVLVEAATGRVVLGDFGIARALAHSGQTTETSVVGNLEYLAPERWQGDTGGPATDLYALGVLVYQLLTGHPPFAGEPAALAYAHLHQSPPPLADSCPGVPSSVARIIDQALAKEPAKRPARAIDLANALCATEPLGTSTTRPTTELGRTLVRIRPSTILPRRTRGWPMGPIIVGGSALAGALLLGGVLAFHSLLHEPEAPPLTAVERTQAPAVLAFDGLPQVADAAPISSSAPATVPPFPIATPAPTAVTSGAADESSAPGLPWIQAPPADTRAAAADAAPSNQTRKQAEKLAREAQKKAEAQQRAQQQRDREERKRDR